MSHPIKKISPLALLEEGVHVPVVPRDETAVCHTQRSLWPKDAHGHVPMLAILLSKRKDVAIVLTPRTCGAKSRRSNVFSARELVLYTGKTVVPPATEEELAEISAVRARAREIKKTVRAEIEDRRARTPAPAARAAVVSAT